jgi:hypothetical protein
MGGRTAESAVTPTSLVELLHEYTRLERISDWKCEKCKCSGGVKTHYFRRRPNVLMVYIDRRQDSHLFGKINRRVTFPAKLDLARWLKSEDENQNTCYNLYAICVHRDVRGSADYGHYIAYVRGQEDAWFLLDDHMVRLVQWSQVQDQHPYLLFYAAEDALMPPSASPDAPSPEAAKQSAVPSSPSSTAAPSTSSASQAFSDNSTSSLSTASTSSKGSPAHDEKTAASSDTAAEVCDQSKTATTASLYEHHEATPQTCGLFETFSSEDAAQTNHNS